MKKRVSYTVVIIISVVNKIINLLITVAGAAFSSYEKTRLYTYFLFVPNLFQFNNILFYLSPQLSAFHHTRKRLIGCRRRRRRRCCCCGDNSDDLVVTTIPGVGCVRTVLVLDFVFGWIIVVIFVLFFFTATRDDDDDDDDDGTTVAVVVLLVLSLWSVHSARVPL